MERRATVSNYEPLRETEKSYTPSITEQNVPSNQKNADSKREEEKFHLRILFLKFYKKAKMKRLRKTECI